MEGETFRFQVELVRLVLGDQEKARAFKSWLALVALRPEAASEVILFSGDGCKPVQSLTLVVSSRTR